MERKLVKPTKSDATSTELKPDFLDLPYAGLLAAARRFGLGHYKHGRFNWKKGDREFAEVRLNHAMNHMARFCEYRLQEDLDATLCNLMMIAWFWEHGLFSTDPVKEFTMHGKTEEKKK